MKKQKLIISAIFLFLFSFTRINAQEAIPVSGGEATGSGGSVSYSVGQVFYSTSSSTNGSVSQGTQQPFEISVVTEIKEAENITLECLAYPNPTTEFVTLKIDASTSLGNLNYQIFDINGKLLQTQKIENNETEISIKNYVSGNYFLKITNENVDIKKFKIIKN